MVTQKSDFSEKADEFGRISFHDNIDLPASIKITKVSVKTRTGCKDRRHRAKLNIDNDAVIIDEPVVDCTDYSKDLSKRLRRGTHRIDFSVDGFDPQEQVDGTAIIEYNIAF